MQHTSAFYFLPCQGNQILVGYSLIWIPSKPEVHNLRFLLFLVTAFPV